jgi:MinD-like ATPase involved in chromosome partitioning or flagellar assembly
MNNAYPNTSSPVLEERAVPTAFAGASLAAHYIEGTDAVADAPPAAVREVRQAEDVDTGESALDDSLADLGKVGVAKAAPVATLGFRGAISRLGFRVSPGRAEQAALDQREERSRDEEIIRQATWARAASILVANPKGGVGKTPTALLLGGVLATVRGGSVCVVEVSDDAGALAYRAEGNPSLGLGELVRDVDTISTAGQLAGYTAPQTSYASVIGTVGRRPRLTDSDVKAVACVIDRFYGIRVMDSGNQPSSAAFTGAVDTADALVLPLYNAGDAALEALALLDELKAAGGHRADLARRAIILRLSDGRPENPHVVARVDQIIAGSGVEQVFAIPFDAHIAERGQLSLGNVTDQTRSSLTAAAAGAIRALQAAVH